MTGTSARSKPCDVLLVSMPFGPLLQPSLGLSLLRASLAEHGIRAEIDYLTLEFASAIGAERYITVSNGIPTTSDLLGEWIFSPTLFPDRSDASDGYIETVLRGARPDLHNEAEKHRATVTEDFLEIVQSIRDAAGPFIQSCADRVASRKPRVLGFTSVFQQHVASLALARRVKVACPETFVLFGGANCEGEMGLELVRQFPFVDAVVSGEGERTVVELVDRVLARQPLDDLAGVYTAASYERLGHPPPNTPLVMNLDSLPYPSYDDFFQQLEAVDLSHTPAPRLLFESSRGCWWGEKHHCTFCGLNGAGMTFRSKSAERALDEVRTLAARHPGIRVSVVDNILDMKYLKDFVPMLAESELELDLFYEVKANLKRDQLLLLREAGIRTIQPGIESFSSPVLSLMDKGVRGIQNIQLLKWCKELGITPYWNILWGFPGESPEDYETMAETLPALSHLQPPIAASVIRLDRFSPNFDRARDLGFTNVRPHPAYEHIYPLDLEARENLAYYFVFDYAEPRDVAGYTRSMSRAVKRWKEEHGESDLFLVDKDGHLLIWDLRPVAEQPLTVLTDAARELYLACDSARTVAQLEGTLTHASGRRFDTEEVEALVDSLVARRLMIREGGLCLSLAVALGGDYTPSKPVMARLTEVVRELGTSNGRETVIAPARVGAAT